MKDGALETLWGSDVIARFIAELGIEHIALNPGASFRGLHDSFVNHLGAEGPTLLLCLHEEHAVAIAHGYAKVRERPMAAIVHSNVGLMHASMAVFNAWCDRAPVMLFGATGPVDAAARRPWIDWIHTARDQAALVRDFVKWDDQPTSIAAARDALLRGYRIATTIPRGPVYINFDAALQEAPAAPAPPLDLRRYRAPAGPAPAPRDLDDAAKLLKTAKRPLILAGRVGRGRAAWDSRIALAETLDADVITDLKTTAAFPNEHRLHVGPAGYFLTAPAQAALHQADVVLALDWVDVAGTLNASGATPLLIQASPDETLARAAHGDCQALVGAEIFLAADPDLVVEGLAQLLLRTAPVRPRRPPQRPAVSPTQDGAIAVSEVADALRSATADRETSLVRAPLSWSGDYWPIRVPLDYLGYDGGAGIGSGPGMAVGAALALKGTHRLPVAVLGDGDFLMGATALWTAAQQRLPLLIVIVNNRSYFNDEIHQERVALARGRPVENKWIGQAIRDPEIDLAAIARAQGADGYGPITEREQLPAIMTKAIAAANAGPVVVDVHIAGGYPPSLTAALSQELERPA